MPTHTHQRAQLTSRVPCPGNTVLASPAAPGGVAAVVGGRARVLACRYGLGAGLIPVQRLSPWRDLALLSAGLVLLVMARRLAAARVVHTVGSHGRRTSTARLPVKALLLRLDTLLDSEVPAGGMPTAAGASSQRPVPAGMVDRVLTSSAGGRLLAQVPAHVVAILNPDRSFRAALPPSSGCAEPNRRQAADNNATTGTAHADAAARLGVRPDRCLAVETTIAGVAAAKAAGMWTIALVPHSGDAAADCGSGADFTITDLRQLRPIVAGGQLIAVLVIAGTAANSGGNSWTSTAS
jgi:hypothetical protein